MYLKKYNLKNKTALVTGAGKGLGRACAIALAEAGANLVIISRTKKDLNEVSKKMISITDVVKLTSFNPRRIFKIKNKGLIKVGFDADITIVDLNKQKKVLNKVRYILQVTMSIS